MKPVFVVGLAMFAGSVVLDAKSAELSLQNIYTDHMVLQRGHVVPIRGRAEVGAKVTVTFNGRTVTAVTGTNGQWRADLPAMEASREPRDLVVTADRTITLRDVLVGDVWLCTGQSNMAFTFGRGIHDGKRLMEELTKCPNVRVVRVANTRAILPVDYHIDCGPWAAATPQNVSGFTALGGLFAMEINRETGVPIGIIQNAWSGQAIEPFICREGYDMYPEQKIGQIHIRRRVSDVSSKAGHADYNWTADEMVKWAKRREEWKARGEEYPLLPMLDYRLQGNEALFHNAMMEPIVTFPIAGTLWYQGESNGGAGMDYYHKLKALVGGWRKKWGYEFPFYLVQLAAYEGYSDQPAGGEGWSATRDAMRKFCDDYPKCGMAVAIDIGNETDIHPKDKLDVAKRMARWALRDVYGKTDLVPCGPLYRDFAKEGAALRVRFTCVGSGLATADKDPTGSAIPPVFTNRPEVKGFAIAGADRKWHWAKAVIDGSDVVVSAPEVKAPVAVRYAYRMNPMGHADLYNREGLPAAPFRTDDWR